MKTVMKNIAFGLVAILAAAFMIMNLSKGFEEPQNTAVAFRHSEYNKITVPGIAIREEVVIEEEYNGYLMYHYGDGEKVSKGMSIATVFANEKAIEDETKIILLKKERDMLEAAQNPGTTVHANADVLSRQILEKNNESIKAIAEGNFKKANEIRFELVELMSTNNIVLKDETGFSKKIEELNEEIKSIENRISLPIKEIESTEEGEFISFLDGFENFITEEKLFALNTKELEAYITKANKLAKKDTGKIGKIVSGFEWYFATIVPKIHIENLNEKQKVKLKFNFDTSVTITAHVSSIKINKEDENAVVVFKSADKHPSTSVMRSKEVDIIFSEIDGIKIPKKAVRFVDVEKKHKDTEETYIEKEMGVYAVLGVEPQFRKIEVLYETNDYVITSLKKGDGDYKIFLQPGDIIVVGKLDNDK